jgi:hypothetical protein
MARATTLEDLHARRSLLARTSAIAGGIVLFAAAAFVLLLQPGAASGPADVHVPDFALHLLDRLPEDRIAIVGGPVALVQRWLSTFVTLLGVGSLVLFCIALTQRRKGIAKVALPCMIGLSLLRPVSPATQMNAPSAVTPATARALLGIPPQGWPREWATSYPENRYMLAQIAFIEGDRAAAARFSAGLTGEEMASPIEAPFRIQFLQGRPPVRTTVCLTSGCFSESVREILSLVMLAALLLGLAVGGASASLRLALGRRCERITELQAVGLRRGRILA